VPLLRWYALGTRRRYFLFSSQLQESRGRSVCAAHSSLVSSSLALRGLTSPASCSRCLQNWASWASASAGAPH
jgi:hypothetical protein